MRCRSRSRLSTIVRACENERSIAQHWRKPPPLPVKTDSPLRAIQDYRYSFDRFTISNLEA